MEIELLGYLVLAIIHKPYSWLYTHFKKIKNKTPLRNIFKYSDFPKVFLQCHTMLFVIKHAYLLRVIDISFYLVLKQGSAQYHFWNILQIFNSPISPFFLRVILEESILS